jgi:glycerol-3-phosphate O-acyltransferase
MANSDIKSSDRRTVLLGRKVMDEVSKVVPVLPVPLVATAIKSSNAPLQDAQIQELCADLLKKLKSSGAQVHVPVETQSYVIEHALETLLNRGALKRSKDGIVIDNSDGNLIDFYANSIIHLM